MEAPSNNISITINIQNDYGADQRHKVKALEIAQTIIQKSNVKDRMCNFSTKGYKKKLLKRLIKEILNTAPIVVKIISTIPKMLVAFL